MTKYELNDFKNGKAFIHQEEYVDGRILIGNRICIDTNGEKLFELPNKHMIVNSFEDEDVAFVLYNEKYALLNNKGEFLTEFVYNCIYGGSEEGLFECKRNGKHGHIDINGKEIVPCMYDDGCYFSEGIAAESLNCKYGMVDYFNNIIIPFEYDEISICKNNLINAKKNGKYGLINKNNEIVIDFIYDELDSWNTRACNVYPAKKDDKWGLINRNNEIIEDFIYSYMQVVSDNEDNAGEFIVLGKEDKQALFSTKKQKFITDFIYDSIGDLSENRFLVSMDNKFGFIDTDGVSITSLVFDNGTQEYFNEGLAVVYQNGKAGMINLHGEIVIPCVYKRLCHCNEGLILATNSKGNYGYIDKMGNIIIPFDKYYKCSNFYCDLAIVSSNGLGDIYIDKTGELLELKV